MGSDQILKGRPSALNTTWRLSRESLVTILARGNARHRQALPLVERFGKWAFRPAQASVSRGGGILPGDLRRREMGEQLQILRDHLSLGKRRSAGQLRKPSELPNHYKIRVFRSWVLCQRCFETSVLRPA